ncbi:amino acid ABC transporter permease [Streptomyces niger]|uniref:amino acid ABC transporter permease n=1 Tax=Streptomyces niger TaxID=66373 RepID=UPI00069C55FA|nr:amino acid ABC transporter permease [Streptomyces niger]
MHVLLDNTDLFLRGFVGTVTLTGLSALLALTVGTLLAVCRVSPVPPLRALGTAAVTVLCNTPLTLLFFAVTLGLPMLGLSRLSYFCLAVLTLGCYTSAFVCEALRSGVNTVETGQAEAARSLGMSFPQTVFLIVLPQAGRAVVPPVGSLLITLTKNSALAGGFSVYELFSTEKTLVENGYAILTVFAWISAAYLLLISCISGVFRLLEHRLSVVR